MSYSSYLWSCRDSCLRESEDLQEQIDALMDKQETLELFKSTVGRSEESFKVLNAQAKTVLAGLESAKSTCRTAEEYAVGMAGSLSGFGSGVVDLAFDGLQVMIQAKLGEYWLAIETKQLAQGTLQLRADTLYWEALAAEAAERAAASLAEDAVDIVT